MTSIREIVESPIEQGTDEIFAYRFNTTNAQGGGTTTVTSPAVVKVYDITDGAYTDVTTTVMPTNSPSIATVYITTSPLKLMTVDHTYRMEIQFIISGNTYERYLIVECKQ